MDRKQSQFTQTSTLLSSDYVPAFGQSTNKKISKADFFKQIKDETQIFIYPTIELLQAANLVADHDFPVYVQVEETGYDLYKITSLAAQSGDIALDNGTTATNQYVVHSAQPENIVELRKVSKVNKTARTAGYYTAGDGGAASYWLDVADVSSPDNGGSVIVAADGGRWKLQRPYNSAQLGGASSDDMQIRHAANIFAFGRNAENAGSNYQGLQIGGADITYGSDGVYAAPDGHASWTRLQPSKNESPLELLLYNTASSGIGVTVNGTNEIDRTTGSAFTSGWIGRRFYFGGKAYLVASVTTASKLTVTEIGGGAVSFSGAVSETYHIAYIAGGGTCTVSGGTVVRVSGDPFIAFITGGFRFFLGTTLYTVTAYGGPNQYTISSPPADGTYAYSFSQYINDQLTTFRIQKLFGENEENLSMYARYDGYWISTMFAGGGRYRKLFLGSGEISSGNLCRQLVLQTNGDISVGGDYDYEAVRVLASGFNAVNRFDFQGAGTGFSPAIRGRGADANVGIGYDTKGIGEHTFTSGTFGRVNFKIGGTSGVDYLRVDNGTGVATLSASGDSGDIDISMTPKGSGLVKFGVLTASADAAINGYIQIKTASGTTIKLATIA